MHKCAWNGPAVPLELRPCAWGPARGAISLLTTAAGSNAMHSCVAGRFAPGQADGMNAPERLADSKSAA